MKTKPRRRSRPLSRSRQPD